jgi:hypothetical protein
MTLAVVPVTFRHACEFIVTHHRHHGAPRGLKFAVGVADDGALVGVATVGRPVARVLDDGCTLEVTRACALPVRNVNSMLYGAAWRVARAMGYRRLITYTQCGESGASVRAAGFVPVARLRRRAGWDTPSRPRVDRPGDRRAGMRWEICSSAACHSKV